MKRNEVYKWKTTSMEDDLNGRQSQWKTTSMEYELKNILMEVNINGRCGNSGGSQKIFELRRNY